ncbi:MAG: glycosyltransferase family 2 protein [Methanomicrobiaceae archaeon]|nr:glycosyltransferase family 2 protein [Methanomicrobiaceae archaeon]
MRSFEKRKVSIVTPCYNGERFLDRYFDAICKQTYDKVELIIVNDERGTDNSERICLSWKPRVEKRGYEFRYVLQKTYKGVAGAINEGLPYVTGEFLIWPDCDDTLMPTSIEKRVEFLNENLDYAMVRSDYMAVYDENPDVIVGYASDGADVQNEDIFDNLIFEKTFCTPGCYMVRSSVLFERIPSGEIYWENQGGQNWQLLIPCAYKNKAGYIDEPLYKYYIRPDSHSRRVDGDEYSNHKRRQLAYQEILYHVVSDFHLLSEDEKADYLTRIELKYVMGRFNLALRYNKLEDAKMEMRALERMNVDPGIPRKILYLLCHFGISGLISMGYSFLVWLSRKVQRCAQGNRT